MKYIFVVIALLVCVCSCNGEVVSYEEQKTDIYQSAISHIKCTVMLAGQDAVHCGHAETNSVDIYNCISENYKSFKAFYVYYSVQGLDSTIFESIAFDGEKLYKLSHDTFELQEKYSGFRCISPTLRAYDNNIFKLGSPFKCA